MFPVLHEEYIRGTDTTRATVERFDEDLAARNHGKTSSDQAAEAAEAKDVNIALWRAVKAQPENWEETTSSLAVSVAVEARAGCGHRAVSHRTTQVLLS